MATKNTAGANNQQKRAEIQTARFQLNFKRQALAKFQTASFSAKKFNYKLRLNFKLQASVEYKKQNV